MPRPVAFSAKQKRQQLQDRRAIKRGELDPAENRIANKSNRPHPRAGQAKSTPEDRSRQRKLQSKFIALTPEYITHTRDLAYSIDLIRPVPDSAAVFPVEWLERDAGRLTCPTRPKFRYDQTKKELERNEEGVFAKWLRNTTRTVEVWVQGGEDSEENEDDADEPAELSNEDELRQIRSPTWFETNLEVWRQLWRVTESSQIILLLLDARCPPLHIPTSLRSYVQNLKPRKEVILLLTKSDLVDPEALEGWKVWVKEWWQQGLAGPAQPDHPSHMDSQVQVVSVRNYDTNLLYNDKPRHRPDLPEESLAELITALKNAHSRLLSPSASYPKEDLSQNQSRPTEARVRSQVDWDLLSHGPAAAYPPAHLADQHAGLDIPLPADVIEQDYSAERNVENEPLTIGLIGQPNVGKSSFLNALLGETRVRASKTPGKTIYWGWRKEVKIVDCPGLVCPSLVGLEVQALCGVLPISQIPSLPACILTASQLLPLEEICRIPRPPESPSVDYTDKRTWRTPREVDPDLQRKQKERWTAGLIMDARAIDRGFTTAKSARPDANRAANGHGRIRWCFFPPPQSGAPPIERSGNGIWLGDFVNEDDDHKESRSGSGTSGDDDSDDLNKDIDWAIRDSQTLNRSHQSNGGAKTEDDVTDSEDDGEAEEAETRAREIDRGFFAALEIDDDGDEDDEDDDSEDDDEDHGEDCGIRDREGERN